ncbi:hypothetical protein [Rhabdochromatium marinum]|uniref:hypothetical protein n=1 Tax=Rhabdochromatium marinum TaxID=48729 RepID=UPI001F5B1F8D|nr:hypothetical protein [Rhabdochromatium marinum]
MPDGLENLRAHNLLTYKSHHEALTAWVLDELIGHYVNYRKLKTDAQGKRHPVSAFGLYAVVTRYPHHFERHHPLHPTAWQGVYHLAWGAQQIRVIVLNRIAQHPRNAAWELFASEQHRIHQGLAHYRARHPHPSRHGHWELLEYLYQLYRREVPEMAYSMEQFLREAHDMAIEEAIRNDPEAVLKRFDPEAVLKRFDPEERLRGLDPEERLRGLDPEERLRGLDPATIEAWLARQRRNH